MISVMRKILDKIIEIYFLPIKRFENKIASLKFILILRSKATGFKAL